MALESTIADRELTVIKFVNAQTNTRQMNMFLAARDQKLEEETKNSQQEVESPGIAQIDTTSKPFSRGILIGSSKDEITDEDEIREALKLIAENERNSKFRDKRSIELEKVQKQAHHTRTKIRIKFPDAYILQGTFGAKEKVQDVLDFVKSNLATPERPFYLFETPPKKVHKNGQITLIASKLVPSCMLYFAWEDIDETKMSDGPFMDMMKVKDKIVMF